ncbi:MAG: EAL domain-containing protein [Ruminococcus sp.]|nr:EAL domain-containing protein [Ruminococcus sp.]
MAAGSPLWNRMFGEGWQSVSELEPDIGMFLIDHEHQTAETDRNTLRMLDLPDNVDYEDAKIIMSQLLEYQPAESQLLLRTIVNDDKCFAGFIKLSLAGERGEDFILPVSRQSRLVAAMLENTAPSLFALLQLEERDRMTLTGAQIYAALSAIISAAPKNTILAQQSNTRFWLYVPDFSGDEVDFLKALQQAVEKCSTDRDPEYDPENSYRLTFSAGCGAASSVPAQRMHTAEYTLYQTSSLGVGSICLYSMEKYESQKSEYAGIRKFLHLVDNNLFTYHFQPIVDVRTAEVIAYEALMRTDKSIGMRPLEVLGYAAQLKRLYDIEKLTMRNTLEAVYRNQDALHSRKLFVNSIPAHMLTDEDWRTLETQYGELMEKIVIELTEQSEPSPEMLEVIHKRLGRNNMQLAIDDYGTGYSNTSNLVKYKPNVVKIDRALIEDIDKKPKMQRLVSGLIEFMHENGYLALAEGVETFEEMRAMIRLGSDLLQGFYVSKPKPILTYDIASNVKEQILKVNLEFSSDVTRSYHPDDGETVDLCDLVTSRYNTVFVEVPKVNFVGDRDKLLNLNIIIKDGISTKLSFKNVFLSSERTDAIVTLGESCDVEIQLESNNELLCRGISVPQTSNLRFTGSGSLHIRAEMTNCFAVGTDVDHSPGNIIFDITGEVQIEVSGETAVGIGGGRNDGNSSIVVTGGKYNLSGNGNACILLGTFSGSSLIDLSDCGFDLELSSANGVGIGALEGNAKINVKNYRITSDMRGSNLCVVGVGHAGTGTLDMANGRFSANLHGSNIKCIGTYDGSLECLVHNTAVELTCEGRTAAGIGDIEGSGDVTIDHCNVKCRMLSSNYIDFGSRRGSLSVDGTVQDVVIND